MRLILASTSRYRRALLQRLGIAFQAMSPQVDETALPDEAPQALAPRLARLKAEAVARLEPDACVIGSDQVASVDGRLLGKPGGRDAAIDQLRTMSGRTVQFHTAVCVQVGTTAQAALDITEVRMRVLADAEIARYLDAEQPWDCAGSFKAEGRGIVLFDAVESRDPTALIGLPLIATAQLLRHAGFTLP